MSAPLALLMCGACAAPVPLPDALGARAETRCAHCDAVVPIAAEYADAIRAIAATVAARRAAEPVWQALAVTPPAWLATAALALVVLLPVIATLIASLLPYPPLGRVEVYALATVPALVPGAALHLWVSAVGATVVRIRDALSAQPAHDSSSSLRTSCRS